MILAVDIGNTSTAFGFYESGELRQKVRITTTPHRTDDEYAMLLESVCARRGIAVSAVESCIIASVVPQLTEQVSRAAAETFGCRPTVVSHGIKTGLNIRVDDSTQLGADIVANTVAASALLPKPFAVADLGTATTIAAVNASGELCGVIIMPGARVAADALSAAAAELPHISFDSPKCLLGKNTSDSMLSGSIYGTAAMIDGMIDRLREEIGADPLAVIATGGLADKIIPHCRHDIRIEPNLTLDGLALLCKLNQKKPKNA